MQHEQATIFLAKVLGRTDHSVALATLRMAVEVVDSETNTN